MIIVKLFGRLGNQMFHYALALNLANKNNAKIKFCIDQNYWDYYLKIFNIQPIFASQREVDRFIFNPKKKLNKSIRMIKDIINPHYVIKEKSFNYDEKVFHISSKNIYLEGCWQSEKYFKNIEDQIRSIYSLHIDIPLEIKPLADEILHSNSVCISVRRGDYLLPNNIKVYGSLGVEYYNKGIQIISSKEKSIRIFIFSDDIEWCMKNFKFDYPTFFMTYPLGHIKYLYDFKLMTLCKHYIIPNSTFSWWAAWLGSSPDKIVVAPEKWYLMNDMDDEDIVPTSWIKI